MTRLKPGTPWEVRRKIRKLEASRDRLMNWLCRLTILMGLEVIVMLVGCLIHAVFIAGR